MRFDNVDLGKKTVDNVTAVYRLTFLTTLKNLVEDDIVNIDDTIEEMFEKLKKEWNLE